ncbi:MAG TPA: right-handed parallel beta-helix repeat-containing protein [Pyrinomonadaceae bacterium]|nr:right-handed parallel beta-helix repeat-containing protein [Pyrinomonadaceae bacterium]
MNKGRLTLNILTTITFILALAAMANAQATRTWVSGVGDDVNPCSRTAPCKTYAGAISKTARDGEISTLDPGGFGTITITKSITLNGGGQGQGYGSILSALAPQGILVNITDAADTRKTVRVNWIDINGASSGTDGIRMIAGNALHIENTNIDGVTGDGIDINVPTGVAEVYIKNVSVRNAATNGMIFQSSGGLILATIEDFQVNNSAGDGIEAGARSRVTMRNGVISTHNGASSAGVRVAGTADADVNVDSCVLMYNVDGVRVDLGTARVANSVIGGGATALRNVGGTLKTFGTNRIDAPNVGVITPISQS